MVRTYDLYRQVIPDASSKADAESQADFGNAVALLSNVEERSYVDTTVPFGQWGVFWAVARESGFMSDPTGPAAERPGALEFEGGSFATVAVAAFGGGVLFEFDAPSGEVFRDSYGVVVPVAPPPDLEPGEAFRDSYGSPTELPGVFEGAGGSFATVTVSASGSGFLFAGDAPPGEVFRDSYGVVVFVAPPPDLEPGEAFRDSYGSS